MPCEWEHGHLNAMGYGNKTEMSWEHTGKSGDDGIDGPKLTDLMIEYGIGCKTKKEILIRRLDEDFFEEM